MGVPTPPAHTGTGANLGGGREKLHRVAGKDPAIVQLAVLEKGSRPQEADGFPVCRAQLETQL